MNFDKFIIGLGISEKKDGPMKIVNCPEKNRAIKNRKKYCSIKHLDYNNLVSAEQGHSNRIKKVTKSDLGKIIPECDALITSTKNIILTITAADCLPIYFFDNKARVIGIAHAGWRGVVKCIAPIMADKINKQYKIPKNDLNVYVGPHICRKHFTVDFKDADSFAQYANAITLGKDKALIDLTHIVCSQLEEIGIKKRNIMISPYCTYSSFNKYYSFRRDMPKNVEAMLAYIYLKSNA